MKNKLYCYLKEFLIQNNWDDKYTRDQGRAIFTTICLTENIDVDTSECDCILQGLYNLAKIDVVSGWEKYEDFERYMIELLV